MRCPRCHAENPAETRFCGGCGAPLPGAQGPAPDATLSMITPPRRDLAPGATFAGRYQVVEDLG